MSFSRLAPWLLIGLVAANLTVGARAVAQPTPLTDAQMLGAARAEAAQDRTIRDSGQDPATWRASRQPDGSIAIHSPDRLTAVRASPDGSVAILEKRGTGVYRRQLLGGTRLELMQERQPEGTPVIPFGVAVDTSGAATATAPPAPSATPATSTAAAPAPAPPTITTPTIRLVPVSGPPDSVTLGQNFRIEVTVPSSQALSQDFTVTLANADGVDEQDVIVTLDDASNGIAVFRSVPVSIGGTRHDWRPTLLPFGYGQVSVGGLTTPGSIMGLDLGNGDSITATITLPSGVASTSIQVFDSPTDQALGRAYQAMVSWQDALRIEAQLLGQAAGSGQFTADQMEVVNGMLANNTILRRWLNNANERAAKESTHYAQLAALSGYIELVTRVYEGGFSATATGDADEEERNLNAAIARNIQSWARGVPDAFLSGTALAFYNGVTAIPFTNAGYTLSSSLYTSFNTRSFNTGQTVWGTEATTGRWVWAWVEIAGNVSLMRMYGGPNVGASPLSPFRDPRARVTPLAPSALQLVNPIERNVWLEAARIAERVVRNAESAGRTADYIVEHQRAYQQLGALANKMGLRSATRYLGDLQDAYSKGHAIDQAMLLANAAVPRTLPPLGGGAPPIRPPVAPPPTPPAVASGSSAAAPVARGWPSAPVTPAASAGPVIPGGVIILDSMLVAQNRIAHRAGLSGVPQNLLAGTPAQQALVRQAVLNPSLVRISEFNVNFGGQMLRRMNASEWALFCSGTAARTGPGATQAGAALPLLGAMNSCFRAQNSAAPDAATAQPAADLEAAADRIDWLGCDYSVLDSRSDCRSYPSLNQAPVFSGVARPWTSFGYDPSSNTHFLGAAPPSGYQSANDVYDSSRDPYAGMLFGNERPFDEAFAEVQADLINTAAMSDVIQFLVARWRRALPLNQSPEMPVVPKAPAQDAAHADRSALRTARGLLSSWLFRPVGLEHASPSRRPSAPRSGDLPATMDRDLTLVVAGQASRPTATASGVKVFFTSLGRSSGEALQMTIVNGTGLPLKIRGHALSLKPLARLAERDVARELQKLAGLPSVTVPIKAYCQNFDKAPPQAGMVFGLADGRSQAAIGPLHRVFDAVDRLVGRGALHPDSDPTDYEDALIQWSIWTLEKKFDERSYTRAFVDHARKNVTAGGRRWTPEIERAVGALAPARWQAIQQVLRDAGVAAR